MRKLSLDFETRSTADLRKTGVHLYASDPTTDVWCCQWCVDDGDIFLWRPDRPVSEQPETEQLMAALADPAVEVVGHNVGFEYAIIEHICGPRYGWPVPDPERLNDTAARAAMCSLPRALGDAAEACGLDVTKDAAGRRLMLQMAKPRRVEPDGTIVWWDDEDRRQRLEAYCRQDVVVERELDHLLPELPKREKALWLLDFKINRRGVQVDLDLIEQAELVLDVAMRRYNKELSALTGGAVSAASRVADMRDWLEGAGVDTESLDKVSVTSLLDDKGIAGPARRVLEIRQEAGKSSTAKLKSFRQRADEHGRVRDNLLYHGAGTGRWSGMGVQLQNILRPTLKLKGIELAIAILKDQSLSVTARTDLLELMFGSVPEVISSCLRSCIVSAPGRKLIVSDFANIEGRVAAWLAGQEDKVEIFRNNGPVYERMAAAIFKMPVEDVTKEGEERFLGKTVELGATFQMGAPKFQSSCADKGVTVSDEMAKQTIETYREVNYMLPRLWRGLEDAAVSAMQAPGETHAYRGVAYKLQFDRRFLLCRLPSGRILYYPSPLLQDKRTPWGAVRQQVTYMAVNQITRKWERISTYGGKLTENCLAAGTLVLTDRGWISIEEVQSFDLVHDGVEFVQHSGTVFKSVQPCMTVDSVWMTPDHEVLTDEGWKAALEEPRPYRPQIRDADSDAPRVLRRKESSVALPVRLRQAVPEGRSGRNEGRESRAHRELRVQDKRTNRQGNLDSRNVRSSSVLGLAQHVRPLPAAFASGVEKLRRSWDHCLREVGAVFCRVLGRHGADVPPRTDSGPDRQRQRVLPRELPVGVEKNAERQQAGQLACGYSESPHADRRSSLNAQLQMEARPVYDIVNAGPRQRFVVLGSEGPFIVHNCVQALARDLLASAMRRLDKAGYSVVLTVHDEVVGEPPDHDYFSLDEFDRLLCELPAWARKDVSCPVASEGYEAMRYRK